MRLVILTMVLLRTQVWQVVPKDFKLVELSGAFIFRVKQLLNCLILQVKALLTLKIKSTHKRLQHSFFKYFEHFQSPQLIHYYVIKHISLTSV
jgi:hypothetical protein